MGFELLAHRRAPRKYLRERGIPVRTVFKVHEGRPNCLDLILNGDVQLLVNTPLGKHAQTRRLHAAAGGDPQPRGVHDDAVGGERGVRRDPVAALAHVRRCGRSRSGSADIHDARGSAAMSVHATAFVHESAYVDDGRDDRRRARRSGTSATCSAAP